MLLLQAHGERTKAGRKGSSLRHHFQGKQCVDIFLLKPARVLAASHEAGDDIPSDVNFLYEERQHPSAEWIEYPYRAAHPILRWLPTKLAEFIGDTYGPALSIAPKGNGDQWTVGELNTILENNLVQNTHGQLRTFGCIEWECELFDGRPKARCYPFDLPKCRFQGRIVQVTFTSHINI